MYYYVWIVVETLLIISSISLWIVAPEYVSLNFSVSIFTLCLAVILFYPRRSHFQDWLKSRTAKNALIHFTQLFLIACILALISYLAWRFPKSVDLTQRGLNTLSQQTIQVLENMPEQVEMTYFGRRQDWPQAMKLLELFRQARRDIVINAIDPETHPQKARSQGVQDNGVVILTHKDKRVSFILKDELSVTNGFLKLMRSRDLKAYFTWGHGEVSCEAHSRDGGFAFCEKLKQQNFSLMTLDLQRSPSVPKDADVVIIWGAQSGFHSSELLRLQRYLEQGGSLLWLQGPELESSMHEELRELVKKWGMRLNNDLVIDQKSTLEEQEATIPIIVEYSKGHPITKNWNQRTLFPFSSSIDLVQPLYSDVAMSSLALTSSYPHSWAEKDLKALAQGRAEFNADKDTRGPISVVAVAERLNPSSSEKDTRIAVIGNDGFIRNAYQNQPANINFTLNVISWLAHDEGLVSLNRPGMMHQPVILSTQHIRLIFFIVVVTIPVLAFVAAIVIYRRRRSL
jgi:ABC-type uncharacterized transport system involved in gliding motility auxiliary subunit